MGKVIGPISFEDWVFMSELLQGIRTMKQEDPEKFAIAIRKERALVDETKATYLNAA